jgi:opacity protein-like surface antigen
LHLGNIISVAVRVFFDPEDVATVASREQAMRLTHVTEGTGERDEAIIDCWTNELGWTAGAGVEAAFADNWTARVEYLFVDFQNATPFPSTTVKLDENLIRLGLDYKFR